MKTKINLRLLLFIVVAQLRIGAITAQTDTLQLKEQLQKVFPGAEISRMNPVKGFSLVFKLQIRQWLDHTCPSRGSFLQIIYLYHRSKKSPNVLVTEGYEIANQIYEPTMILQANQIIVEYRFHGHSRPDKIPWELLTQEQAMQDFHAIRQAMSRIYKKSWTVTGISKGGTTAALYALRFPKDMKAAVAYVAPFAQAQEDPRTMEYYRHQAGTEDCRRRVREFQRSMLLHRNELIPMLDKLATSEGTRFSIGEGKALEYAAMEFPFSFWQWGFGCSEIPEREASAQEIFEYVEQVVDFNYYDDQTIASFEPAFYQFMTEFGYYGFDTTGISDLLQLELHPSNLTFCPKETEIRYRPEYMKMMTDRAIHHGKHIIYIYGAIDTWSACAIQPDASTRCPVYFAANIGHRARIRNLSEANRKKIYKTLHSWTRAPTIPLPY